MVGFEEMRDELLDGIRELLERKQYTALRELQEYVDRWNRSEEYRAESQQMQVQFELNYVDESELPEYQGRFTVTNYYTVAFTADAAGEVAIDD